VVLARRKRDILATGWSHEYLFARKVLEIALLLAHSTFLKLGNLQQGLCRAYLEPCSVAAVRVFNVE